MADVLAPSPALERALAYVAAARERLLDETVAITAIPAPTFGEAERAAYVRERLLHLGLADVRADGVGNVLATRPGSGGGANLLLMAHLDTVFPAATPLAPALVDDQLRCPGVGDNSVAVAGLLLLAEALDAASVTTAGSLHLAFTVGEEGLGNLRGAWAACEALAHAIDCAVAVEGHFLGRIVYQAVGSQRYQLTFRGPGGHSWEDTGRPSAIHALGRAIAALADLQLSQEPRATLNVGTLEGGSGVNVVAARASAALDLRSVDQQVLDALAAQTRQIVAMVARREGLEADLEEIGARPAGSLPAEHPLVAQAQQALRALGVEPTLTASSTDANVPLALGIPAIALGITHGGGMHTLDEWIATAPVVQGIQQLLLVADALTRLPRAAA
jgi:acetylornithine deacetylase/succinyl-diaminopimelate desuccinylase-like protein